MASSEPFLHPSKEPIVCRICNENIKNKKKARLVKNWDSIREQAKQWRSLEIPPTDRIALFSNVFERIQDIENGYVHDSCRTDFRLRLPTYKDMYTRDEPEITDIDETDKPLGSMASPSVSTPCTRSSLSSPTVKRNCFICNSEKEEKTCRISKEKVAVEVTSSKEVHLKNPNSPYHIAAKRLDLMLQGPAVDVYAVDVYYHAHCMVYFNRLPRQLKEEDPMIEVVLSLFINYIKYWFK